MQIFLIALPFMNGLLLGKSNPFACVHLNNEFIKFFKI